MKSLETREVLLEAGVLRANNLKPTHPKLSTISSNNKQKGFVSRAWAWYVNDDHHWIEKQRGILVLAALMVAGMSFYSGIKPPNKILSNNQNGQFSYLSEMDDFNQFVGYNSFIMITSLAIVLVLISGFPLNNKFWIWVLTLGTLFIMVTIVGNYWASLSNYGPDGYVNMTVAWICWVFISDCVVVALIHTILFLVWVVMKLSKPKTQVKGNHDAGEV